MYTKYGWKFETVDYEKGEIGIGADLNTNIEWGNDEREFRICIYLFKKGFMFGKYHYISDKF